MGIYDYSDLDTKVNEMLCLFLTSGVDIIANISSCGERLQGAKVGKIKKEFKALQKNQQKYKEQK